MKTIPFFKPVFHSVARFLAVSAVAAALVLQTGACKRQQLVAKKMTAAQASYVYAYTAGSVSKETPIRVRFTSPLVATDKVGTPVDKGVLSMKPSMEGNAIWEDDRTIRFVPAKSFESNGSYLASVQLDKLFKNVPAEAETFEFDFKTRSLHFDVEVDGIEPENANEMAVQQLTGTIITSDPTDNKALEKVLTAEQNGKKLTINWLHNETQHRFIAKGVQRTNADGAVKLAWQGKSIGVSISGNETVEVPKLGTFKVTSAKVKHDAEQYVQIRFSDPVQTTQDYKGLITFNGETGTEMRFNADGNSINLYPTVKKSGKALLNIATGIKSNANKTLTDAKPWSLEFDQDNPKLRVLGRGVIMPNNDGLQFPFEAINLKAVHVEIFKIFNNNVLQFLQTNDLTGGHYGLEHVGRVVLQKRIPLTELSPGAKADKWTRYAVDLSKLIKADPQAIYQVRIGFKASDTNMPCNAGKDANAGMAINNDVDPESNGFKSIMDYYGEAYDENDKSGCTQNYDVYGGHRFISRNVIASNLGIIAKRGTDGSTFVVVSDLLTTEPKKDVKLDFIDGQNQLLATAATDGNGTAKIEVKGKPYIILAHSGDQQGYLPISDANSLNLSRFDVSGDKAQKGLKGYLYGERGVWRPGDSLYLNFVLEDKNAKLPENYPIQLELYDSKGILQHRSTAMQNVKNIYPLHFATRTDAPTGTWRADVKVGGATFSQPVKIETVKPNRLKINLDFGKKEIAAGDEKLNGTLQLNWLHGAVAKNLKAKVEVVLNSVPTKFDKFKEYVFDAPTRSYKAEPQVVFDAAVNENGLATVTGALPKAMTAPGKMKAGFKIRAFEAGGDFSSDYFVVDYSPFQAYAGIKIPKNKYGEKRFDLNKNANVQMVCVDKNGAPMSNRSLDVNIYRVDWRWWWENGSDDQSDFSSGTVKKILQHETLRTDDKGVATISTTPKDWGRYMVFVTDAVSGHSTGDFFYAGYPWDDDEENNSNDQSRNAAAMLNFSVNKPTFKVGESIELNIPTAEAGKVLISIENGSKVLSSEWVSVKSGGMTKYSMKATPEMAPTAYAFITVVQPHNQVKNDLPIRMYGVEPLHVEDPKTRLEPIVKCPDVLKPEEKVTIEVSEKSGKGMAYTIAIVDDGLLDLTRFKTPNPWDVFYAREALGVQTFDLYDQVLGAQGGQMERILNIGGDGFAKPKNAQKANRFKPVVMNLGPFYSDGGTKKHTVTIPNYVGSVRAMVVASNGAGAYGSSEKTMAVKKPLMVLATLPRVLGPGEQLKLPVNVFAMEDKVKNVTVKVEETTGRVNWGGETTKSINFARPGDEIIAFDFKVNEKVGIAKFKITASGNGESATEEIEMEVRNPNPMIADVKETVVPAGQSWEMPYNALGTAGSNEATLEVSNYPPIDMSRRLSYLLQYPHGCVEQTTSAAFPQIFADKVLNLNEEQKKQAANNIKAAIEKLKQYQHTDGGFGYWPGDENVDTWSTNYVGHFLLEAKNAGYALPPTVLERWITHQQRMARKWTPPVNKPNTVDNGEFWSNESAELNQTYRLYTLAVAKQAEIGSMNALRERKGLTNAAKWRLAAAYALIGKAEVAKEIVSTASTEVRKYREMSYTYGSDLRDQAMILETLTLMGEQSKALSMLQTVSRGLSSGDWYSTQATAYGLLAASKFVGNASTGSFSFNYDIDGKTASSSPKNAVMQVKLPADGSHKVGFKNTGKGQLFVRVVQRGQPATGDKSIAANNLNLKVTYKTLKGSVLNPASIPQGTDFIAEVTVTNPGLLGKGYKEMALTQVFPSGWEIHNARMDRLTTYTNTAIPEYQDIRDDRVLSYFDIAAGKSHTYRVQLNAAYLGKYYLPTTACEAMYDNTIAARQPGMWVEVVPNVQKPM